VVSWPGQGTDVNLDIYTPCVYPWVSELSFVTVGIVVDSAAGRRGPLRALPHASDKRGRGGADARDSICANQRFATAARVSVRLRPRAFRLIGVLRHRLCRRPVSARLARGEQPARDACEPAQTSGVFLIRGRLLSHPAAWDIDCPDTDTRASWKQRLHPRR